MLNPMLAAHGLYSTNWINRSVNAGEVIRHKHKYLVDTTAGQVTMQLHPNPVPRMKVRIKDYASKFDTNTCIMARNGKKIMGLEEDYEINTKDAEREFEYIDDEKGWQVK